MFTYRLSSWRSIRAEKIDVFRWYYFKYLLLNVVEHNLFKLQIFARGNLGNQV